MVISIFRLGIAKLSALDELEREAQRTRPLELEKGEHDRLYREAIGAIAEAMSLASLKKVVQGYMGDLEQLPKNPEAVSRHS